VRGPVGLYREPGRPMFDRDEIGFIRAIAPHLAHGARTGLLVGEASAPQLPDAPGLIVITKSGEVESFTPGVERWMADLPGGNWDAGLLPSSIRGVAAQAIKTGEGAHPARITPLLMSVYGLTEREQEVMRLVLHGDSTTQIAAALVVSPHTVQDRLKSVLKTGVRSRRDLVGKVFFAHYEPRLRDNEHHAASTHPLLALMRLGT
jgi:DNA-binding CsgD family transcriptional regulator